MCENFVNTRTRDKCVCKGVRAVCVRACVCVLLSYWNFRCRKTKNRNHQIRGDSGEKRPRANCRKFCFGYAPRSPTAHWAGHAGEKERESEREGEQELRRIDTKLCRRFVFAARNCTNNTRHECESSAMCVCDCESGSVCASASTSCVVRPACRSRSVAVAVAAFEFRALLSVVFAAAAVVDIAQGGSKSAFLV